MTAILLPKAESLAQARHAAQTGLPVIPIIETARGVLNLAEVAATPGVARLAFGSLDYALDLGLSPDSPGAGIVLDHARIQVLLQTRAAGLPPALDGVFPGVQDTAGLARAASRAQQMGFGGMLCIHPAQVPVIHGVFAPAAAELDWARRVLAAHRDGGPGAFMLDGRMVDAPVIARARQCWRKRASRYSARACRPVGVRIWGETRREAARPGDREPRPGFAYPATAPGTRARGRPARRWGGPVAAGVRAPAFPPPRRRVDDQAAHIQLVAQRQPAGVPSGIRIGRQLAAPCRYPPCRVGQPLIVADDARLLLHQASQCSAYRVGRAGHFRGRPRGWASRQLRPRRR